jgi:hypothetical protein
VKKATQLFEILSYNHTKPLKEKYAKVVLQVATLEERINTLMSFGMVDRSKELQGNLIELLEAIRKEFVDEENNKK